MEQAKWTTSGTIFSFWNESLTRKTPSIVLFLLDANVLITAHNNYYPIDQVPEFWSWIQHQGETGHIKIPLEINLPEQRINVSSFNAENSPGFRIRDIAVLERIAYETQ